MIVGILALQGGVAEHAEMIRGLGHRTRGIRRAGELEGIDALILPGGESTTMNRLIDLFGLRQPLIDAARRVPTMGSCAGLILLSRLGVLDVDVERNAFGPQVDSESLTLPWGEAEITAAFIRAPAVTRVGGDVEILSTYRGSIVAVRQGDVLGMSFHPELTGDATAHRALLHAARPPAKN
ncbi:pyridoxal 5'-phosphate synthase glutaminase subunit PdxT [Corynebacterium comes]|uniref:Pyridoxal 5'-phosphate synthase subunit PdxT n=1 Tax=Corynebacterium comes TaxID=2675218 RepID=A0A6B8VMS8_9CORY|nr:pyridoxal 5'-phosphate synthase glutaminase subunit PdxT [Corynebacterium comes]QGU05323.1 Glutamine amidotransferase subunit PdxT [Corynebacterium comes]